MITEVKTKNHDEWVGLRSKYIGGSDAAAVVGLNPFKSAYSLWAEKTGKVEPFQGNLTTEVGTYLEEFVAKKFAEETGKKVRRNNRSILNDDYPWAIANIDREIVGEDAGLEIKTTSEMNLSKFKNGDYPGNYYCQCLHYMAMTGKEKWYLAVLIGNRELKIFTIDRDDSEIKALMDAERDFWHFVTTDTAPYIDGSQSTTEAIKSIHEYSKESKAQLMAYDTSMRAYMELGKQIKELQERQNEIANGIKAFMGDSESGESDAFKVSWKTSFRNTFDSKRFIADHKDEDLSQYMTQTSQRTFRITERK